MLRTGILVLPTHGYPPDTPGVSRMNTWSLAVCPSRVASSLILFTSGDPAMTRTPDTRFAEPPLWSRRHGHRSRGVSDEFIPAIGPSEWPSFRRWCSTVGCRRRSEAAPRSRIGWSIARLLALLLAVGATAECRSHLGRRRRL